MSEEKRDSAAELATRLRLRKKFLPFGLDRKLMIMAADLLEEWPSKPEPKAKKKSKTAAASK
jgi:hypothetical protein